MKFLRHNLRWLAEAAGAAVVLALASPAAFAQGCAMCATTASAAKAGALQALRDGILILFVPAILILLGIWVVIYRSRDRFLQAESQHPELGWESNGWEGEIEPVETGESASPPVEYRLPLAWSSAEVGRRGSNPPKDMR